MSQQPSFRELFLQERDSLYMEVREVVDQATGTIPPGQTARRVVDLCFTRMEPLLASMEALIVDLEELIDNAQSDR
ncbi:MAG: hypothetical protein AMS18_00450 [Gemmatimonas sp. SG8_17]|nr:MAG: hypothetical protein AMS18_00450 [Gemmatimonas sp. SG8_17]